MYKILIADNESVNVEIPVFEPETEQQQNQELPALPETNEQSLPASVIQDFNLSGKIYISCAALILLLIIVLLIFKLVKNKKNAVTKSNKSTKTKESNIKYSQSSNVIINLATPKDIHKCIMQFLENTKLK